MRSKGIVNGQPRPLACLRGDLRSDSVLEVFKVLYSGNEEHGIAYDKSGDDGWEVRDGERIESWAGREFELRDGIFSDLLASAAGCRLCSTSLRSAIETVASDRDRLCWYPVSVLCKNEVRPYYILQFPEPVQSLRRDLCLCAGDFVIKPVFSQDALRGHSVFTHAEDGGRGFFVDKSCKANIQRLHCTGITFARQWVV